MINRFSPTIRHDSLFVEELKYIYCISSIVLHVENKMSTTKSYYKIFV